LECPACGCGILKLHAHYSKYHRNSPIDIVRVLCTGCGTTHAIIPSFSLPGSSHDTEDVEKYLAARESGQTRREAGTHFLAAGRDIRVLKRIERCFGRCILNWSAIFAVALSLRHPLAALASVVAAEPGTGVFLAANRYALGRGVNAVFASRSSILLFRTRKALAAISHNPDSPQDAQSAPDSS